MAPIKIYVGNIPSSARNSELKELFEKFGKVIECDILKDFGFVHMDDSNDAKAAIAGLNDTLWKGSRIRVELSTTKTSKGEPSLRHKSMRDGRGARPPYSMPPMGDHRSSMRNGGGPGPMRDGRYGASNGRYMPERGRPYPDMPFEHRGGMMPPRGMQPPPPPYRGPGHQSMSDHLYMRGPSMHSMGHPSEPYYRGPPPPPSMQSR
jgi:RNA recognition motif-containing protein